MSDPDRDGYVGLLPEDFNPTIRPDRLEFAEKSTVDCGTCPVGLMCMASNRTDKVAPITDIGASGYRCGMCGSVPVRLAGPDGRTYYLFVDCEKNTFPIRTSGVLDECVLCAGNFGTAGFYRVYDLGGMHWRVVRSVYSARSWEERIAAFDKARVKHG